MNHLHLVAPDVPAARAFYERYFDYRLQTMHGDGVFLRDADGFLLVIDPSQGNQPADFPDWFHVGFCLPDPGRVRALHDRMRADGVRFARELREFGDYAVNFYCYDPGGFKVEVSWNRE